jgi:hypothetical protein
MFDLYEMLKEIAMTEGEGTPAGDVQPVADTSAPEGGQTEPDVVPEGDGSQVTVPDEIEIDGEKVRLDDVREWKKGSLRQSDYTRKTQELAAQRKQMQEAVELYEFLQKNPTYAQKLAELTADEPNKQPQITDPRVAELDLRLTTMQIERDLSEIKSIDSDVDEVELLNLANERRMPLKDAYTLWKGLNFDKLVSKKLANNSQQLTEQIKKGQQVTKTLVRESDKPTPPANFGLSQEEMRVADGMGLSYEEYSRWR